MSAHKIPLPQTNQTAAQTKTILLVEDETLIALSEKLMLQKQGFSVLIAADGQRAVETALRTPEIDLVLMDINLGSGIDGTEAAQQILAQRDLPILFLSSHIEREVVEKTEKITSYGYVVKHSGETVLLASIKMAFKLFDAHQKLKQQETALRESESRLKEAQRIGKIGNWEWIISENKVLWSDEMYAIFGIPQDIGDLSAEMTIQAFHPDDRAMIAEATRKTLEERQPQSIEARLLRPDGSIHYVLGQGVPVLDARGQLSKVRGIYQDITDRKQAEEALHESLQASVDIVQSIPSGFFIYQFEAPDRLILLSANPEAERLTGIRAEQWKGREFNDIWPEARKHGITEHYLEVMRTGVTFETEDLYYSDGRLSGAFRIRAFALPQNRLAVAFENITERKRMEEVLRESEALFRLQFELGNIGIAIVSPEKAWLQVNQRLCDMLGYSAAELRQTTWDALTHPDDVAADLAQFQRMAAGEIDRYELDKRFIRKDGAIIYTHLAAACSRNPDRSLRFTIGSVLDITDRKHAEEALRKSEEKFRALFDNVPIGVALHEIIVDHDNHPIDFIWLDCNPAYETMTGLKRQDIIGKRGLEVLPSLEHKWIKLYGNVALTGEAAMIIDHSDYLDRYWEVRAYSPGMMQFAVAMEDVTDRRRTEEALRISEERLRLAHKATNDVVWDWDVRHDAQQWNESGKVVFGWTEIVEHPVSAAWWVERVHPDDRQRVDEGFFAVVNDAANDYWHDEYRFQKVDGSYAQVMDRGYVLRDEQGRAVRMIGAMLDITDRKQAEETLRESEANVSALLENADGSIWSVDLEYRMIVGNTQFRNNFRVLLGREPQQGDCVLLETLPQTFLAKWRGYYDRALSGETFSMETVTRFLPQSYTVEYRFRPIHATNGVITGVTVAGRNITDRKQAEEVLQKSEEKYRKLFDEDLTGDFIINSDGIIQDCNPAFMRIFGYADKTELLGQPITIVYPDRTEFDYIVAALKQRQKVEHYETTRKRKDGVLIRVDINLVGAFDERGELLQITGYLYDITTRKQAEEALRQSEQQLRELNAQKDKFFSILAHDLKNPLIGFLSFADLLEHNFGSMDSEERKMLIQHFRTSAETLFALLENLLTWARLQHGQVEYYFDQFPIDQLAAHAVDLLTPNAEQKQIRLINTTPLVSVYASIEMVGAVVRNLLANAIKFTPFGGEVTITAAQTDHDVQVTVADTGIGIPAAQIDQLFRIDGKTQREGTNGEKGTGLGLILCKEFVEKQGGQIWVESEPGKGTRVMFTLPMQPRG